MRKLAVFLVLVLFAFGTTVAWAAEPAAESAVELSLNDFIEKAIMHDKTLKGLEVSKDQAWEMREKAADNVNFIPAGGGGPRNPYAEAAYTGLLQSDINYLTKGKDIEKRKKEVAVEAYTKYITVLKCQQSVLATEKFLERDMANMRAARDSNRVGTLSNAEMRAIEATVKATGSALEAQKASLEKAYLELNDMIGLWPQDRPVLTDDVEFASFREDNLMGASSRALKNSEDLWTLDQLVRLQRMDLSYFDYGPGSGQLKPYEVEKFDVEIAQWQHDNAEQKISQAVYTLYQDILALEEQYLLMQASMEAVAENLRVTEVKYAVGMATDNDLKKATAAMAESQQKIANSNYDHAILVANYKKLTGSGYPVDLAQK